MPNPKRDGFGPDMVGKMVQTERKGAGTRPRRMDLPLVDR